MRIADFINKNVANRSYHGSGGKVVMKMDIEGIVVPLPVGTITWKTNNM